MMMLGINFKSFNYNNEQTSKQNFKAKKNNNFNLSLKNNLNKIFVNKI